MLRLAKNKPYAVIYDFVTLTEPLEDVNPYNPDFNCEKHLQSENFNESSSLARSPRMHVIQMN